MQAQNNQVALLTDFEPDTQSFLEDLVDGLSKPQKSLPSKYFYDQRGSQLFDQICELEEYYPTRTELAIMQNHSGDMARVIGPECLLVEYGSGSSIKTRLLLDNLETPVAYMPLDISRDHLESSAETLNRSYPDIEVLPICADFTRPFDLPDPTTDAQRRVVYFPGSTLGNFTPESSELLLRQVAQVCGNNGGLLLGLDLHKDTETLERAYNDASGVTAQFNLNILARANRELDSNFNLPEFDHVAFYNTRDGRIEMHLRSRSRQTVSIDDLRFHFDENETICTEYSHKFCLDDFRNLAARAGLIMKKVWTDDRHWFGVVWLTTEGACAVAE
jgi:dimethylhistidine N-methyltransferase